MVKKLEKGSTVTCSKCHKEDHKSNKCPQPRKKLPDEKNKKKITIKSCSQGQPEEQEQKHHLYNQEEGQWQSGCSQGWEERLELEPLHLGAQESHHQYKGA